MVETGATAVVHNTARMVDGPDASEVVDTTDVDVALAKRQTNRIGVKTRT